MEWAEAVRGTWPQATEIWGSPAARISRDDPAARERRQAARDAIHDRVRWRPAKTPIAKTGRSRGGAAVQNNTREGLLSRVEWRVAGQCLTPVLEHPGRAMRF